MTQSSKSIQLVALFGYLNNHATVTLDELRRNHPDVKIQFFYWMDFPKFRSNNNWELPEGSIKLSLRKPLALCGYIRETVAARHVYFHGFSAPRFWMVLLLWVVVKLGRCENILVASEGMKKKPRFFRRLFLRTFLNTDRITHLGIGYQSSQDYFDIGLNKWKYRKYAFCEKYDLSKEQTEEFNDKMRVLSVGQLIERKNHSRLIEAVAGIENRNLISVEIAGSGALKDQLEQQAARLGVDDFVEFKGFCTHDQLHRLFSSADVFVLQSYYDGWGVVVAHALHYGLPILISPGVRSGKEFLLDPGKNGYITNSSEDLRARLLELALNPELRDQMSQHSFKLRDLWGVDTVASRFKMLLENPRIHFASGPFSITCI